jgi:hypothetical protein
MIKRVTYLKGVNMQQIILKSLLNNLVNDYTYLEIYTKDGDGIFHTVNSIDILNERIDCGDGWYHYFEAFDGENNFLYVK